MECADYNTSRRQKMKLKFVRKAANREDKDLDEANCRTISDYYDSRPQRRNAGPAIIITNIIIYIVLDSIPILFVSFTVV